jgi:hypothetical protein
MWIGIFCGGFVTAILLAYQVKGAIIAGILLVSIISWPRPTSVTYFPYTPVGNDNFDFFKKVVTFHGMQNTLAVQDWNLSGVSGQFGLAFITFLYDDILDFTGTLYSIARFAGAIDEKTQDFEGSAVAYPVDCTSPVSPLPPQPTKSSFRYLNRLPLGSLPSDSLHRIRRRNLRRRQDRPHSHHYGPLLLHLHLLRTNLRLDPSLGHRLHAHHLSGP